MLKIQNLNKNFNGLQAVNNVSFEVKDGEIFGLLGRNGAGKSTTIKMMVGLLTPDSGEITYNDKSILDKPLEVKKKLVYIPDVPYVYEKMTGMDFLFFFGKMYGIDTETIKQKSKNLIELFNLEHIINQNTENFSHGMRQKLILSASLLVNPKYIILDEPMVGLDPQSAKILKDILVDISHNFGVTILLSTHQLDVATQICDKIGIIHKGELKSMIENKNYSSVEIEDLFLKATGEYKKKSFEWLRE